MFFWSGHKISVSLADGSSLRATTQLSIRSLRLRDVVCVASNGDETLATRVIVPVTAILAVQILD